MTVSVPGKAGARIGRARDAGVKALAFAVSGRALPLWLALAWFCAVFATELWLNGLAPLYFQSPDEAVNRLGALQISLHASPALPLPFPDPEDLLHPRHWVSLEGRAIPGYAPVAIYVYGFLTWLGKLGFVLVSALPASAAAAFVLGTARLLPPRRGWLAFFAPGLGFPALYWLIRPWMNLSALLVALSWAFCFWTLWFTSGKRIWLLLALAGVGAAAAVRPDYAAYLFSIALCFSVAARPAAWKDGVAFTLVAGATAVALNLLLNKLTTGKALEAAYQILAAREQPDVAPPSGLLASLERLAVQVVVPLGVRPWSEVQHFLYKYWVELWPLPGLLLAQLALLPLLFGTRGKQRWLYAAALLLIPIFLCTRIHPDLFGADQKISSSHHSIPRYWSPVYWFAALPPLLFVGRARSAVALLSGALAMAVLMALGLHEIASAQSSSSLKAIHHGLQSAARSVESLHRRIPADALVYSTTFDKALWSSWRVATVSETNVAATADSMERALAAGFQVFVADPRYVRVQRRLGSTLRRRHLALIPVVRSRVDVFRVERAR